MKRGYLLAGAILALGAFAPMAQAATPFYTQNLDATTTAYAVVSTSFTTDNSLVGTIKAFDLYIGINRNNGFRVTAPTDVYITFTGCVTGAGEPYNIASYSIPISDNSTPDPSLIHFVLQTPLTVNGACTVQVDLHDSGGSNVGALPISTKISSVTNGVYFAAYDTLGDPPVLSGVHISSNNGSTTMAKVGDTATLTFNSNVAVQSPTVTIAGHSVNAATTTGNSFSASYTFTDSDIEASPVPFTVQLTNTVGDAGFTTSTTSDNTSVSFDKTAPTLTITGGTIGGYATSSPVVITFTNNDASATIQCAFDGAATSTCTSAATSTLADGAHTFFASSTDTVGNTGTTSLAFTVDTTPPTLTLNSTPAAAASSTSATFAFTPDATSTVVCALDGAATSTCTSPATYSGLSQGTHTFAVVATDPAGNATTASSTWSIDTTAPTLAEVSAIGTTTDSTPDYTFTSSEAGTITYGGSCTSGTTAAVSGSNTVTFATLAAGTYSTCTIVVTDAAGNASAPLSVSSFVVTTPPAPSSGGGGSSGGSNGPPVGSVGSSQGLPQAVQTQTQTTSSEHASTQATQTITTVVPPAHTVATTVGIPTSPAPQTHPAPAPAHSTGPAPTAQPQEPLAPEQASVATSSLAAAAANSGSNLPLWLGGGAAALMLLAWLGKKFLFGSASLS